MLSSKNIALHWKYILKYSDILKIPLKLVVMFRKNLQFFQFVKKELLISRLAKLK